MDIKLGEFISSSEKKNKRKSIRIVVKREDTFLVILSKTGYPMIPGGGVELGESHFEAGVRELREETGYIAVGEPEYIGKFLISRKDLFEEDYYYETEHIYYSCDVKDDQVKQRLSDNEKAYGHDPVWMTGDEILEICDNLQKHAKDYWLQMMEILIKSVLIKDESNIHL